MQVSRTVVDKLLGTICLTGGMASTTLATRSLSALVRGPSWLLRLGGLIGLLGSLPLAAFGLYVGYYLVRYPPERLTTAANIARTAAHLEQRLQPTQR